MVQDALLQNIKGDGILTSLGRITQTIPDFIRGNPIVSTALIGIGTTGLVLGAKAVAVRRKKKKTTARRRTTKRAKTVKKRRKSHASPRHKGHKRVSFKTASGKTVRFLVRGQKRSPSHSRKKSGRFVKGSKEAKRFMAKLRRMKK